MTSPADSYLATPPTDKTSAADDERIDKIVPLPPPEHLIRFFPIQGTAVEALVTGTRRRVKDILHARSDRLLVVIGPCSIHDPGAAIAYAEKLSLERKKHSDELEVLMRVYFEKPRTTESQVHRELASGLSAPVGFKNGTDGNVKIAVDALLAARQRHHFLSVHKSGQVAIVETRGNDDCHIILRGGKSPNYDAASVAAACQELARAKLQERLMIDCSHANAAKQYKRQMDVAREIGAQLAAGERRIVGVMVESHLVEGRQELEPGKPLEFGQSITDACLGWSDSTALLAALAEAVRKRRK